MLSSIRFKFGSTVKQPPLEVQTPPSVTIFVGPNNSGKSQALRELVSVFRSGQTEGFCVVDDVSFDAIARDVAVNELKKIIVEPEPGAQKINGYVYINHYKEEMMHVPIVDFLNALQYPNSAEGRHRRNFSSYYLKNLVLALDGPSRIQLINPQERGDLKKPASVFARLFVDDEKRSALRKLVYDSTGLHFVLDASVGSHLHARFGSEAPPNERSLEEGTLDYMRDARGIESVSDGVKAFTGILLQLHVGQPRVITVDEPEAFLHPSLAFTLGKELAKGAVDEGKHVFASTHSAQFLMGAISSGAEVNIIRLTYQDGVGTARLLPSAELKVLMRDPLLRSVGVLEGLFFDCVVVGEANADRAFYQEINERLLAQNDGRAAPRTLFLNADNKQTIPRIIAPLRKLGIPTAGIVDIDVFKDGGAEWTKHLGAIGLPEGEYDAYASRRSTVFKALEAANKDFKTQGGITLLKGGDLEMAKNLLADLGRYGLFVVPRGEVEHWLMDLDVARSKNGWLRSIFEKMGSDPNSDGYVKPGIGDVWDFMGEISGWLKNRNRRGIPA
ncbi:ATP-dependent nuclease [Rhizobium alvei]|uniref:AAA family ATPase n=1 Tax=Rhizobium alvei TaxID=1132659 RepID=A0ABT8YSK6_9HYPH|nr:AAA family ATPase [Rhizobium alvei]MDO6966751.1 AAA family ATPase [Rhizobium alvei]